MSLQQLFLFAIGISITAALEAQYFYTPIFDRCQFDGVSALAGGISSHGSVCAFVDETRRIYACPAPDPYCWSYQQTCAAGAERAGPTQIKCQNGSSIWCCRNDETCTTTPNQINICISNFTSPNAGVDIRTANRNGLRALGVSSVTATTQTAKPTPFSTQIFFTSSTTTTTPTGSPTTSATTNATTTTSTSQPSSSPISVESSQSGISGGAIAGIVIGVVAGLVLVAGGFWIVHRRRDQAREPAYAPTYPPTSELETKPRLLATYRQPEAPNANKHGYYAPHEMPA